MAQNKTGEPEVAYSGMNLIFGFVFANLLQVTLTDMAHGFLFV